MDTLSGIYMDMDITNNYISHINCYHICIQKIYIVGIIIKMDINLFILYFGGGGIMENK